MEGAQRDTEGESKDKRKRKMTKAYREARQAGTSGRPTVTRVFAGREIEN